MNRLMLSLLARGGVMAPVEDGNDLDGGTEDAFDSLLNPESEVTEETSGADEETESTSESETKEEVDEGSEAETGGENGDATTDSETKDGGEGGETEETPEGGTESAGEDEGEVSSETETQGEVDTPQDELTDEQKAEQYQAFREGLEKDFAISEEDATLLIEEPETVMPKLAANLYERVMTDAINHVASVVPQMIMQSQVQAEHSTKMREQFYEANPGLVDQDDALIQELINTYAPLVKEQHKNSNLTQDELIRKVGMTIAASLGVDAGKKQEAPPQPPKPSTQSPAPAPAAPARQSGAGDVPAVSDGENDFLNELIDTQE